MKIPFTSERSKHDLRWSKTMLHLSESDLRFLVETVATNRRDYDYIVNLVRDKEDLLEPMLDDPKLTARLFRDEKALVRVTPHMLFSVLLRRLRTGLWDACGKIQLGTFGAEWLEQPICENALRSILSLSGGKLVSVDPVKMGLRR
jgi:hypothetical protein